MKCKVCGRKLDRNGYYCSICLKDYNTWRRNRTRERHEKGICTRCGKKLDKEGWFCTECNEKKNAEVRKRNAYRRANNLCYQCGKPTGGKSFCQRCLDIMKKRRDKK